MRLLKNKFFVLFVFFIIFLFATTIYFKDPSWVRDLKSEARGGDAKAQYELAEFYNSPSSKEQDPDYKNSFRWYQKSAAQGYMPAKLELAMFYYYHGQGVEQNKPKAFEMLLEGARKGDKDFQFRLAQCYFYEALDEKSDFNVDNKENKWFKEANKWYKEAANQGHIEAHFELAKAYSTGFGVEEDLQQTVNWYTKAANLGSLKALHELGLLFAQDFRVMDYESAFEYFKAAAEQGYLPSQFNLGLLYKEGAGVEQNYNLAKIWFDRACDSGEDEACEQIEELKILGY